MDGNGPVVANTGSSSKVENDLVGSRKRKRPEPDRSEIENEENDFVVGVSDTGNVAEQMQGNGPMDEEMHSVSSKLLGIYPGKLQLPFKANQLTSCSLQLTNTTDDHVAVRLLTKCPKRYMAKMPLCCIVPPKCIYTHIVTDSAAIEFSKFFKEAKEMADDKVYELKLSVISDPLKETTYAQIVSNRKFSHVLSMDVHPTEPWILMTNQAGEDVIWDYQAQFVMVNMLIYMQAIAKSFDLTQKPVYSAKFIEREEWIVAGDGYGTIYVYSYHTEEEVTNFEAHDSNITSLAVHPTDPLVLSSSEDRLIKLWDWEKTGSVLEHLRDTPIE
ncbi:unnamed protein product [Miscanthus lutarioriparius]|uniref:Uncharacterized protein n=1 Tax=Miscanthus lutarioriparius TaxID=422564 RepID=A0A811QMZ0_9POAL|nr:unnamed protein product [Miscanthus lutarioriparius]